MTHRRLLFASAAGRVFAAAVLAVFGILSMPVDASAQAANATLVGNVRKADSYEFAWSGDEGPAIRRISRVRKPPVRKRR